MNVRQIWMITGASQGLGLALAKRALDAGHIVVATTRSGGLPIRDPHLHAIQLDVTDFASCASAIELVARTHGRLDVLVNNAGYGLVGAIEEVAEAEARSVLDVDLLAPLWMSQAAMRVMRAQGSGHIAQISSVGGVGAMPFFGLYNAAKWGLEGFSEALAGEAAAFGVRVTIAEVGAMGTNWATSSMQFSAPLSAYDKLRSEALGASEVPWPSGDGGTGGGADPSEIAERLYAHLSSATPGPLRLVLGEDAPAQIGTVLEARIREYRRQGVDVNPLEI